MDNLLYRVLLLLTGVIGSFFFFKTGLKKNSFIVLLFAVFIFFSPAKYILLIGTVFCLILIVVFVIILLTTFQFYRFKVFFYALFFFMLMLIAFLIQDLTDMMFPVSFLVFIVPFVLFSISIPDLLKNERLGLGNPFYSIAVSVAIIFPPVLFFISMFLTGFSFDSIADTIIFSFFITVFFAVSSVIIKPVLNIISGMKTKVNEDVSNYLTRIIAQENVNDILLFTKDFLMSRLPLRAVDIKKAGSFEICITEKRGRPLFYEEYGLLKIIERNLNTRLRNINFTKKLEEKILEIARLQEEISEIKLYSGIGQMLAGVTHQLKTPISILLNSRELLLNKDLDVREKNDVFNTVSDEILRLNEIVDKFLSFIKTKTYSQKEIIMPDFLEKLLNKHHFDLERVRIIYPEKIRIIAASEALEELILNLVQNAFDSISEHKNGLIKIKISSNSILISDNGPPVKERNEIFKPFYSTKAKGIGLGLTVSKQLADILDMKLSFQQKRTWKYFNIEWGKK